MRFSTLTRGLLALTLIASTAAAASLQQITTNFGSNPTNVGFYIYIPASVTANPAVIVAMHYCTGTAQAYFSGTQYATLADQHGFIVIYPNAPTSGGCWDVASTATLTHNAGGDSLGIASMVRYTISTYGADASRIFMTGTSSGAMMTNVLAGSYPDLFVAGAAFSGVPYGCFAGSSAWNSQCATGELIKTAQEWGDEVRAGYPGYTGARPRLQMWHGTVDTTLYYQNLIEENKEWSNVLGVTWTKNNTNTPDPNYTQMIYGDGTKYVAYSAVGVGHTVPVHESAVLDWFGITGSLFPGGGTSTSSTAPTSTTTTAVTSTTSAAAGGTIPKWGQCGGISWTGSGTCAAGSTCTYSNAYYSQCL
ncbi:related to Feruloyl esterase B [Phialocephala subalpina]|uniref:Carboxylic ester hydrolase n=1 Tax=Phialocephala subalpina TaxID=576137 RepID=A0A1L7XRL1_9HELO|nr:related to Feruloyl esterase B [Phialocephala subalpina]